MAEIKYSGMEANRKRLFYYCGTNGCDYFECCKKDHEDDYEQMKIKIEDMKMEIVKVKSKLEVIKGNLDWLKQSIVTFLILIVIVLEI